MSNEPNLNQLERERLEEILSQATCPEHPGNTTELIGHPRCRYDQSVQTPHGRERVSDYIKAEAQYKFVCKADDDVTIHRFTLHWRELTDLRDRKIDIARCRRHFDMARSPRAKDRIAGRLQELREEHKIVQHLKGG